MLLLKSQIFQSLGKRAFQTGKSFNFHAQSEAALQTLLQRIEASEAALPTSLASTFDCEYSQGVLTVRFTPSCTFVINKQPPTSQIWLSSPFSGPRRFSFAEVKEKWLDVRNDAVELESLLESEFSKHLKFPLIKE